MIYWHSRSSHTREGERERETNEPGEHLTVKTPDSSYSDLITSKVDSIHHPQRNTVTMNQPKHSNCFVFSNCLGSLISKNICALPSRMLLYI